MLGVVVAGLATMLAAALGWISYGHLVVFLGVEILVSLWFSRLRIRESWGPVTNRHAKAQTYTVKVDGREVERHFRPVQGQPLTTQERHWLANNNAIVLSAGGAMAVLLGVMVDPGFIAPLPLLSLLVLVGSRVLEERRFHAEWTRRGLGRTADPTVQDHDEYWRLLVFICFGVLLAALNGLPRFQTYTFAVVLMATDLFLHGRREKWAGFTERPPSGDLSRAE